MKNTLIILVFIAIGALLGINLFPKVVKVGRNIPVIVTKYDTVRTKWVVHDTIEKFTTDTFNLVVHQTIYDTVVINVTDNRPAIWPIMSYRATSRDSAYVRTFDLRTGSGALNQIYTPGPLNVIVADSLPTPNMTFGTYPEFHTRSITKLLWGSIGFGICTVSNWVNK